ncbi:hypothetical protein SNEBB_005401 [Seison nebaliae]|nr:hypothetical protein SNEBB_005401 [Seison nebaliae]
MSSDSELSDSRYREPKSYWKKASFNKLIARNKLKNFGYIKAQYGGYPKLKTFDQIYQTNLKESDKRLFNLDEMRRIMNEYGITSTLVEHSLNKRNRWKFPDECRNCINNFSESLFSNGENFDENNFFCYGKKVNQKFEKKSKRKKNEKYKNIVDPDDILAIQKYEWLKQSKERKFHQTEFNISLLEGHRGLNERKYLATHYDSTHLPYSKQPNYDNSESTTKFVSNMKSKNRKINHFNITKERNFMVYQPDIYKKSTRSENLIKKNKKKIANKKILHPTTWRGILTWEQMDNEYIDFLKGTETDDDDEDHFHNVENLDQKLEYWNTNRISENELQFQVRTNLDKKSHIDISHQLDKQRKYPKPSLHTDDDLKKYLKDKIDISINPDDIDIMQDSEKMIDKNLEQYICNESDRKLNNFIDLNKIMKKSKKIKKHRKKNRELPNKDSISEGIVILDTDTETIEDENVGNNFEEIEKFEGEMMKNEEEMAETIDIHELFNFQSINLSLTHEQLSNKDEDFKIIFGNISPIMMLIDIEEIVRRKIRNRFSLEDDSLTNVGLKGIIHLELPFLHLPMTKHSCHLEIEAKIKVEFQGLQSDFGYLEEMDLAEIYSIEELVEKITKNIVNKNELENYEKLKKFSNGQNDKTKTFNLSRFIPPSWLSSIEGFCLLTKPEETKKDENEEEELLGKGMELTFDKLKSRSRGTSERKDTKDHHCDNEEIENINLDENVLNLLKSPKSIGTMEEFPLRMNSQYSVDMDKDKSDGNDDDYCSICYADMEDSNTKILTVKLCNHKFCENCLAKYILDRDVHKKLPIECPTYSCHTILNQGIISKYLPLSKIIEILSRMLQTQNIHLPSCHVFGNCQENYITSPDKKTIWCFCGETYCIRCRRNAHFPLDCENAQIYMQQINELFKDYVSDNYVSDGKPCPKCGCWIEKISGCLHMRCGICSAFFCWHCGTYGSQVHHAFECSRRQIKMRKVRLAAQIFEQGSNVLNKLAILQREKYVEEKSIPRSSKRIPIDFIPLPLNWRTLCERKYKYRLKLFEEVNNLYVDIFQNSLRFFRYFLQFAIQFIYLRTSFNGKNNVKNNLILKKINHMLLTCRQLSELDNPSISFNKLMDSISIVPRSRIHLMLENYEMKENAKMLNSFLFFCEKQKEIFRGNFTGLLRLMKEADLIEN